MRNPLAYFFAIIIAAFGFLTLFLSASVIFDWFDIRSHQGDYVLFVVWGNFICSFCYLTSAIGFIKGKRWTFFLLGIATTVLLLTFIGFLGYVNGGGIYEDKTMAALIIRMSVTFAFLVLAYYLTIIKNNDIVSHEHTGIASER